MLSAKKFEHLYQVVAIAGAAGMSPADASIQTGYELADVEAAFAEPATAGVAWA